MKNKIGYFIIGSAIIWGGIIIATAFHLRGIEAKQEVVQTLSLGFISHLILIWGPLVATFKKDKLKK